MALYISDKPAKGTSLAQVDTRIPADHIDRAVSETIKQAAVGSGVNVSGLSFWHKRRAIKMVQQAAVTGLHNRRAMHYTQGAARWEGIRHDRKAWKGEFPHYSDCSAFVTWCIWNGLDHYHVRDVVNGSRWGSGWTGSMLAHGHRVSSPIPGDAIIYYGHTAIYTGGGLVISHGSEGGPYLLRWNYRPVESIRRYI